MLPDAGNDSPSFLLGRWSHPRKWVLARGRLEGMDIFEAALSAGGGGGGSGVATGGGGGGAAAAGCLLSQLAVSLEDDLNFALNINAYIPRVWASQFHLYWTHTERRETRRR
ncbi:hypothetical protein V1478_017731 [Vespula squamosa]|uniref:Uncharacterized protein n=1 Tax=Vespula squamosa TaxID=30214 RepID=A0ABD1ZX65_VESSQ